MDTDKTVTQVKLPAYQGPLDLLLTLIQQEKVDIYDIPIARIADQFVEAIRQLGSMDMEVTTEFLVLAAQLLYIKSRELLPKPPKTAQTEVEEEDLRQELVERLIAYRTFKQAAQLFEKLDTSSGRSYFREVNVEDLLSEVPPEDPLKGIVFDNLWQAFCRVIERAEKGEEIRHVKPDEIAIERVLADVLRRVLLHPKGIRFYQLMRIGSRMEMVVSFLALLELLKSGKIRAEQPSQLSDIMMFPTAKAWEFTEEE
ncbi:ScpA family protein [Desulfosporosinus sp. BICA1-9]|uniref:segregation and condensation protein A n=1 Tax=Desulfosporosinus sp. BICA1-9 TaxID=1531958 RepID=UPI00054C5B32|nr:segregation/condensation protein A [Desulfosporosinus sp. BICA1-9]KJS47782.1 MAG: rifampin ADP-ribosyl transferase [Peptococcaceae bacterium BRH_c23]KJS81750.1 MAG: rifampin ADP-ribosyl transferase [Desulfosporosinus sp. BICA1-9]KJS81944.1 MAG: rifampin ADP-ribosyl transferase [Desulfosporosinus sp. BICA1-9]